MNRAKNLLFFLFLWIILPQIPAYAQALTTVQGTVIEKEFIQAKKQKKLLLIDFYTDWCATCRRMDTEVLAQTDVNDLINDNFVPIKLNGDNFEAMDIADALGGVDAYPTYFVLNDKAQVVGKLVGYYSQTPLTEALEDMLQQDDDRQKREAKQKAAQQKAAQQKKKNTNKK